MSNNTTLNKNINILDNVHIHNISSIEHFTKIHKNNNDVLNVLYFMAEWCGPCKRIKPLVKQEIIKMNNRDDIHFFYIDIDRCLSISEHYKISTIPTIIVEKNNTHLYRLFSNDISNLHKLIDSV